MKENQTIHIRKTVRPMRFLFLVSPNDFDMVKQVIRINTALWGGYFNPIISVNQSIENILSLYKASHSDVIVNFTDEIISNLQLGLENYQVMKHEGLDGLLKGEKGKYQLRYGCDMRPLMRFFWKEEGRFQLTSINKSIKNPYFYFDGKNDHWNNYALLEFGQYPLDHEYDYKSGYQGATNCTMLQIDDDNVAELTHKELLTPLIFTLAETEYSNYGAYSRHFEESVIFIGNLNNANDWIEFWNSRCFYSNATFIHWEDIPLFENHLRNISKNRKSQETKGREIGLVVQKSSSLSMEIFSAATKDVAQIVSVQISIKNNLHPIGLSYPIKRNRRQGPLPMEAPIVNAYEEEDIAYVSGNKIEFKAPIPEFLINYSSDRNRSWCTTIDSWRSQENSFWLKIPSLGKIEENLQKNFFFFSGFRISSRENIVLFPRCYSDSPLDIETIYLPNHLDILKSIFSGYKIEVSDYSEKGRYATAIEEAAAQGIWFGANILLDRGVQAILDLLSKNNGEDHLPRTDLEKLIGKHSLGVHDKKFSPAQIVDALIYRKILRIGLELKCTNCYRQGWYHISQISESFKCHFCFLEQNLPVIDNKKWRYRSSGLFSSQHVGHGSLPVICLNLYLQTRYRQNLKSFYSFNIKLPSGELREVDSLFIRHEMHDEPELLICECKTGNAHQDDFDKLEKLCELMPGAVACLATWKDEFSENEKDLALNFWNKGFEIVLLTRLDIESKGINFEGVDDQHKYINDFTDLAYATYQKYLKDNHCR